SRCRCRRCSARVRPRRRVPLNSATPDPIGMANGSILVLNTGSSSLKFALYDGERLSLRGRVESLHARPVFRVQDGDGTMLATREWDEAGAMADQRDALHHILAWIGDHY